MSTQISVTVGNLQGKVHLTGRGHTPHEVQIDYIPPFGEDDGFMSLELLLISLARCSGHAVLLLLRKMGMTVNGLEVGATGTRRDEHPTMITDVELDFRLQGEGLDVASVEKAIQLAEETYCPVWAMLKGNVAISWTVSM